MFEVVFLATAGFLTLGGVSAHMSDIDRFPRSIYGALVSWWYGGFSSNTAPLTISRMIDCDYACEAWCDKALNGWKSDLVISNPSLGVEITAGRIGKVAVLMTGAGKDGVLTRRIPVSTYEDYQIYKSFKSWKKRKKKLSLERERVESSALLENRINHLYVDTIEMIEKRILDSTPETAPELRAMLPPPDAPFGNVEKRPKKVKTPGYFVPTL
jgi:hypothetical protein